MLNRNNLKVKYADGLTEVGISQVKEDLVKSGFSPESSGSSCYDIYVVTLGKTILNPKTMQPYLISENPTQEECDSVFHQFCEDYNIFVKNITDWETEDKHQADLYFDAPYNIWEMEAILDDETGEVDHFEKVGKIIHLDQDYMRYEADFAYEPMKRLNTVTFRSVTTTQTGGLKYSVEYCHLVEEIGEPDPGR